MSFQIVLSANTVIDKLNIAYYKDSNLISNSTSPLLSVAPLSIHNTNSENLTIVVDPSINISNDGIAINSLTLLPNEEVEISHSQSNYFILEYVNGEGIAGDTILISQDKYTSVNNDFTLKNSRNVIYFTSDTDTIDIIEDETDKPVSNRFYELKNNDTKTIQVNFGFDIEINKDDVVDSISLQAGASIRLFKKSNNLFAQSYKADDDSFIDKSAFSSDLVVEKLTTNNALYLPKRNRYYRAINSIDRVGLDLKDLNVSDSFYIKCDAVSQVVFFNGLEAITNKHDFMVNAGDKLLIIVTEIIADVRIFDIVRTSSLLISTTDDELRDKFNIMIETFNNLLLQRLEDKKEIENLRNNINLMTSSIE
ncbi:hypothetical protein [Francisella marina]|uniref:Uncharacterized protein n=1 Tax=Francisella marina TaxID=2249302 RepID=A0ABX5ZH02_9GAMM|nr:hypothetical protein [Francisella marina]QEO57553.1 hypothetical protein F0R74_06695 [Francisella marina]